MGAVESKVNVDAVRKMVDNNPVIVFTKPQCGFCQKAKDLLEGKSVEYTECDLDRLKADSPKEYTGVVNGLVYTSRQTSVPQVFICGKFIGGFTELNQLEESKKLLEAVAECTGENAARE